MARIKMQLVRELICIIFIFLFVYTALSKLQEWSVFKSVLQKSPVIGTKSEILVWLLPTIELLVAGLLFLPKTRRIGLYISTALMFVFTIYIGYMLVTTQRLPCSCGGVLKQMTWKQHFVFNLVLTLVSFIGIIIDSKNPQPRKQPIQKYSTEHG